MALDGRMPPAAMFPAGRADLRTRYLELSSGLHVRAVEAGDEGAPAIIMLPGWGCSTYVFRENLSPLARAGFHPIAVDLKGHGLSDKPESPLEYRLDAMVQHVVEILDAVGVEKVVLAGLSMGAALAAHVASALPHRVQSIVMVSPVGFDGIPGLPALRSATPSTLNPFLPQLASRPLFAMLLRIVNGRLRTITERDVDEYWAPTQFPEFTKAMRNLIHEFSWNSPVPALDVPALLVFGRRDRLTSTARIRFDPVAMHASRQLEIKDAGHVVYDEAAPIVNQAIVDFIRDPG